jgi:precorrin-2 dehydrogenase / sirohydrochlorin ferrochelatase
MKDVWNLDGQITSYYGLFLNLVDKPCVVVGGGNVAERKIKALIESMANVIVVSPEVNQQIECWARNGLVQHIQREYRSGDIRDALLVFAATNCREVNQLVYEEASRFGKLVNIADSPESCSFIVPAICKHNNIQIALTTSGKDPALAKKMRIQLESDIRNGTSTFLSGISRLDERS